MGNGKRASGLTSSEAGQPCSDATPPPLIPTSNRPSPPPPPHFTSFMPPRRPSRLNSAPRPSPIRRPGRQHIINRAAHAARTFSVRG